MEEIWRDIKDYKNLYQVSNFGNVRSLKRKNTNGKILKPIKDKDGYFRVTLSKNNVRKNYFVHRLVAQSFIPNVCNLPQVNHKDVNPSNNRAENLEWCNSKYNNTYGDRLKRLSKNLSKPIIQYDFNLNYIKEWISAKEASTTLNINRTNIVSCLKGKRNFAGNYIWKYK